MADQELAGLIVKIRGDLSDYVMKLSAMESKTNATANSVNAAIGRMSAGFGTMSAGIATFAAVAIKGAMDWGNAVDDLSDKTGMAGEDASKLLAIAKRTGMDTDTANQMFAKFGKSVYGAADAMKKAAEEGKTSDDVLTKLGVTAVNSDGSMRSTLDIFKDVKNSLNGMADGWQKTAFEMALFGRSGAQMHDVLKVTDLEMQMVIARAVELGLILSTQQAAAWERFKWNVNSAKGTLTALGIGIGTELLPQLESLLSKVGSLIGGFIKWKNEAGPFAQGITKITEEVVLLAAAFKGLAFVGLRVPPWMIPILLTLYGVNKMAESDTRPQASKIYEAEQALRDQGEKMPEATDVAPADVGMGDLRLAESRQQKKYEPNPPPPPSDKFIGGGGGGDGKKLKEEKTAYELYIAKMKEIMALEEARYRIGDINKTTLGAFLDEQMAGLSQVVVTDDEIIKRDIEIIELRQKQFDLTKEEREEAKRLAEQYRREQERAGKDQARFTARKIMASTSDPYQQLSMLANERDNIGGIATADQTDAMKARYEELGELIKQINEDIEVDSIGRAGRIKEAYADMLSGLATNTMDIHDVLRGLWTSYVDFIIRKLMSVPQQNNNIWAMLFQGAVGSITGGGGGDVGPQMTYDSTGSYLVPRASGGPVAAGRPYLVGEKRPEIFVPQTNGVILPDARMAFGGSGGSFSFSYSPVIQGNATPDALQTIGRQYNFFRNQLMADLKSHPGLINQVRKVAK